MITFKQFVSESINDKGRLKALFVIGLPGAGKSYTISKLRGEISPLIVNTDRAAEFLSAKWGEKVSSSTWKDFRDSAHRMTKGSLKNYVNGLLPLFVDGTSNNVSNILHRIGILESLGYDVGVVFVHTSLETAIKRAKQRAASTSREVDEEFIKLVYDQNEENAAFLKNKVPFFRKIDNDTDELTNEAMLKAFKQVQKFFEEPINNPVGVRLIKQMQENKVKYMSPEIIPMQVLDNKIAGWYKV